MLKPILGETPFKCELCDKGFIQKVALQYHMNSCHGEEDVSQQCKMCGKTVYGIVELRKHMATFHDGKFELIFSKFKNFRLIFELNFQNFFKFYIFQRFKISARRFACSDCSASFATQSQLEEHREEHENQIDEIEGENERIVFDISKIPNFEKFSTEQGLAVKIAISRVEREII